MRWKISYSVEVVNMKFLFDLFMSNWGPVLPCKLLWLLFYFSSQDHNFPLVSFLNIPEF